MPSLNLKAHLEATTRNQLNRLVNDLKAIPAEKQTASLGGSARTPLHILAECGMVNSFVGQFLATGTAPERPSGEARDAFLASFDTEEKTLAYFSEQTEALITAFHGLSEDTLGETTNELFGRPMTRLAVAELPAIHMSYHDPQLTVVC